VKRPRGNRRSKALVEHDMIALVERMQLRNEDAKDAGKALGIPATTAQRLARKGLLRVLAAAAKEKIKAIADADSHPNPMQQGQFELPEPVQPEPSPQVIVPPPVPPPPAPPAPVSDPEFIVLPDGTKRRIKPQQPTEDIYEWSHVMDYSSFRTKTPWRQAQLINQWRENEAQGGKPVNLRGGAPSRNCFGCGKGPGFCDCEEVFQQ
jgi:hypothetical protein